MPKLPPDENGNIFEERPLESGKYHEEVSFDGAMPWKSKFSLKTHFSESIIKETDKLDLFRYMSIRPPNITSIHSNETNSHIQWQHQTEPFEGLRTRLFLWESKDLEMVLLEKYPEELEDTEILLSTLGEEPLPPETLISLQTVIQNHASEQTEKQYVFMTPAKASPIYTEIGLWILAAILLLILLAVLLFVCKSVKKKGNYMVNKEVALEEMDKNGKISESNNMLLMKNGTKTDIKH